jgi:enolase
MRYRGMGVLQAVENVRREIAPALAGRPAPDQQEIDSVLIQLDGTADKSRLGANAMVGVSIAVARAAAVSEGVSLYRHLGREYPPTLPVPMLNILNGGKHAQDSTDVQEFMVVPAGFSTFRQALQAGAEVYRCLRDTLQESGLSTNVGDEGGFAPKVASNREALELVLKAIQRAGYSPEEQCLMALDVAASELVESEGTYSLPREGTTLTSRELVQTYEAWAREYPIISIEDGMGEDDWSGWTTVTARLGDRTQQVGDDLYTTSPTLVRKGIERKSSNAVLVKPNQIGTVTETLETVSLAKQAGWGTVISHRSGETEDTTVADLAVGTGAGQIKAGAPCRSERTAKYNRLLRIEEEMGDGATFAGLKVYSRFLQRR